MRHIRILNVVVLLIALASSAAAYTFSANTVGFKLETSDGAGNSNIAMASLHDSSGVAQDSFVLNGDYSGPNKLNIDIYPNNVYIYNYNLYNFDSDLFGASALFSTVRGGIVQQSEANTLLQGEGTLHLCEWAELNDQTSGTISSGHCTEIGGDGGGHYINGAANFNSKASVVDSTSGVPKVSTAGASAQLVHAETTGFGYLRADQGASTSADDVLGAVASQNVYADTQGSTQDPDALAVNENLAPSYSYANAFSQDPQGSTYTDAFVANGNMGMIFPLYYPIYQVAAAGSISANDGIQRSINGFDEVDMPDSTCVHYNWNDVLLSNYEFSIPTQATSGSVAGGFYETSLFALNFYGVAEYDPLLNGDYARVGANVYNAIAPSGQPVINPFVGAGSLGAYSIAYQGKVGTDYGFGVLGLPIAGGDD